MFTDRPAHARDPGASVAITMDSISAGRKEVASFCAGTSLVAYTAKRHFTGRAAPVDDLSWWKPFLQLRGPDRIAGPAEATRLFNRNSDSDTRVAEKTICIDHSEDDVPLPSFAGAASIFTTMRNRAQIIMPAYHDDDTAQGDVPEAYVIAERVTAPVELRFFPQRPARTPMTVDC